MIAIDGLTKTRGGRVVVDTLSFEVRPGCVTGFLGPNGAGKTTTMRLVLGLVRPDGGRVAVCGQQYATRRAPLRVVGSLLDARAWHGGRRVVDHLTWLAQSNRIARRRVAEVLDLVGLSSVARVRAGALSLGAAQRLGIAAAMLGDPEVLVLDEPANGLDAEGVRWLRDLLRRLGAEGRTVLLSSHLMAEMEQTADRLVVIGRGRLLADASVSAFVAGLPVTGVRVRARAGESAALAEALTRGGATVTGETDGTLVVRGIDGAAVGEAAAARGMAVHELVELRPTLETAYLRLTAADTVFRHGPLLRPIRS